MKNLSVRSFLLGVLAAVLPAVGAAWAFATIAAEHVLQPHLASAAVRVRVMCSISKAQNENILAICAAVKAPCPYKQLDSLAIAACDDDTLNNAFLGGN